LEEIKVKDEEEYIREVHRKYEKYKKKKSALIRIKRYIEKKKQEKNKK